MCSLPMEENNNIHNTSDFADWLLFPNLVIYVYYARDNNKVHLYTSYNQCTAPIQCTFKLWPPLNWVYVCRSLIVHTQMISSRQGEMRSTHHTTGRVCSSFCALYTHGYSLWLMKVPVTDVCTYKRGETKSINLVTGKLFIVTNTRTKIYAIIIF